MAGVRRFGLWCKGARRVPLVLGVFWLTLCGPLAGCDRDDGPEIPSDLATFGPIDGCPTTASGIYNGEPFTGIASFVFANGSRHTSTPWAEIGIYNVAWYAGGWYGRYSVSLLFDAVHLSMRLPHAIIDMRPYGGPISEREKQLDSIPTTALFAHAWRFTDINDTWPAPEYEIDGSYRNALTITKITFVDGDPTKRGGRIAGLFTGRFRLSQREKVRSVVERNRSYGMHLPEVLTFTDIAFDAPLNWGGPENCYE